MNRIQLLPEFPEKDKYVKSISMCFINQTTLATFITKHYDGDIIKFINTKMYDDLVEHINDIEALNKLLTFPKIEKNLLKKYVSNGARYLHAKQCPGCDGSINIISLITQSFEHNEKPVKNTNVQRKTMIMKHQDIKWNFKEIEMKRNDIIALYVKDSKVFVSFSNGEMKCIDVMNGDILLQIQEESPITLINHQSTFLAYYNGKEVKVATIGSAIVILGVIPMKDVKYMTLIEGTTHIAIVSTNGLQIFDFFTKTVLYEDKEIIALVSTSNPCEITCFKQSSLIELRNALGRPYSVVKTQQLSMTINEVIDNQCLIETNNFYLVIPSHGKRNVIPQRLNETILATNDNYIVTFKDNKMKFIDVNLPKTLQEFACETIELASAENEMIVGWNKKKEVLVVASPMNMKSINWDNVIITGKQTIFQQNEKEMIPQEVKETKQIEQEMKEVVNEIVKEKEQEKPMEITKEIIHKEDQEKEKQTKKSNEQIEIKQNQTEQKKQMEIEENQNELKQKEQKENNPIIPMEIEKPQEQPTEVPKANPIKPIVNVSKLEPLKRPTEEQPNEMIQKKRIEDIMPQQKIMTLQEKVIQPPQRHQSRQQLPVQPKIDSLLEMHLSVASNIKKILVVEKNKYILIHTKDCEFYAFKRIDSRNNYTSLFTPDKNKIDFKDSEYPKDLVQGILTRNGKFVIIYIGSLVELYKCQTASRVFTFCQMKQQEIVTALDVFPFDSNKIIVGKSTGEVQVYQANKQFLNVNLAEPLKGEIHSFVFLSNNDRQDIVKFFIITKTGEIQLATYQMCETGGDKFMLAKKTITLPHFTTISTFIDKENKYLYCLGEDKFYRISVYNMTFDQVQVNKPIGAAISSNSKIIVFILEDGLYRMNTDKFGHIEKCIFAQQRNNFTYIHEYDDENSFLVSSGSDILKLTVNLK